jgi:AraC-like DNA-binding protein
MVFPAEPPFISKQVERGEYYFLDLQPAPRAPLAVVCGGREVCGVQYRIDRCDFPYHSIELVVSGRGSVTLDELQRVGSRQTPRSRRMAALLLQQLVLLAADEAVPAKRLDSRSWEAYRRCRDQMEAHVERVSSLADVARACGLSPAHVCRLFRHHGDRSPHQALLRLKMARAASLLLERGLLVREAAEQVGFPDPYHFSKAFKRVYGASPEAFREGGGRAAQPASAIRRRRSASASPVQ